MALTRPRLGQLITNVVNLTDSMTVINSAATQANVDVGFIFNRADGVNSVANVALYWNESLQTFTFASTNDAGQNTANINPIAWANVTAGNITANGIFWPNGASYGASIIAAQSVYSNANVAAYLLTSTGNISAGNVIVGTGLYFSNGTPFSTGTASVAGLNGQLQYNNNGVLAGANISFFSSNISLVSTANITTTGNIVGGGVRSTTSTTPPVNPVPGDVWYNSSTDQIYRYTQDATSSYWLNVYAPVVSSNSTVVTNTVSANANVASYVTVAGGGFPAGVYYIPYGNIGNYTGNTQLGSSTNFFYNSSSGILAAPTGAFNQINAQVDPFTLVPTTLGQMNFGNATTTIFMGASSGKVQMAGNLNVAANVNAGNVNITGSSSQLVVNRVGYTGDQQAAMVVTAANTKGGTGYGDFLQANNTSTGATNSSKWFRIDNTGQLQIINSAYNNNIFNLDDSGNLGLPGVIKNSAGRPIVAQSGSVIQTQYVSSGTRTSADFGGGTWGEPSTNYRVTITPQSSSSYFLITYHITGNPNGNYQANTIYMVRAFRLVGGTKTYALTGAGTESSGNRAGIAGMAARPSNGFDLNDTLNWDFKTVDAPATTNAVTYGFEFRRESGGTGVVTFGQSASTNAGWGWDANIVITVMEIAQ